MGIIKLNIDEYSFSKKVLKNKYIRFIIFRQTLFITPNIKIDKNNI